MPCSVGRLQAASYGPRAVDSALDSPDNRILLLRVAHHLLLQAKVHVGWVLERMGASSFGWPHAQPFDLLGPWLSLENDLSNRILGK